jgi:SAM-dependent methyltransferase
MDTRGQRAHDWQSAAYATYWVADAEARDPERAAQLALLASFIPQPHDARIRVLDLGAGYGAVTQAVLAVFPNAQVTLQDYSEAMLDHARTRLEPHAPRLQYAQGDLSRPGWEQPLNGPFHAVVSASVLHNLNDGPRIGALYGEIARVLMPGGAFLNLDHVSAGGPLIERQFAALRARPRDGDDAGHPAGEHNHNAAPRGGPVGGHAERTHAHAAAHGTAVQTSWTPRFPGGLAQHLEWLRAAGFAEVDCFWKSLHRALYGGYLA